LGCLAGEKGSTFPRRAVGPGCRARVASRVSCFGRGAVLVLVKGRSRWRSRRTPASSPGRVQPPCQELAREPARPVCRGSRRRRAVSGRAAAEVRVLCCEPAVVPWTCVAGAGECKGWPAAPRARHGHAFATSGGQRGRAAPRRARGIFPWQLVFGPRVFLVGEKKRRARAEAHPSAGLGRCRRQSRRASCAAARRGERQRGRLGTVPGCGREEKAAGPPVLAGP
jgi:hypothetical protein